MTFPTSCPISRTARRRSSFGGNMARRLARAGPPHRIAPVDGTVTSMTTGATVGSGERAAPARGAALADWALPGREERIERLWACLDDEELVTLIHLLETAASRARDQRLSAGSASA